MKKRRIQSYNYARYPQGSFIPFEGSKLAEYTGKGINIAAILALTKLTTCDFVPFVGTTGPPPAIPEFMTENEAREVIVKVFQYYHVQLISDVEFTYQINDTFKVSCKLDGYNDSLKIGYEYYGTNDKDDNYYDFDIDCNEKSADDVHNYPYDYLHVTCEDTTVHEKKILCIDRVEDFDQDRKYLENLVRQYIDQLKAQGLL